jgi:hypothetical protein
VRSRASARRAAAGRARAGRGGAAGGGGGGARRRGALAQDGGAVAASTPSWAEAGGKRRRQARGPGLRIGPPRCPDSGPAASAPQPVSARPSSIDSGHWTQTHSRIAAAAAMPRDTGGLRPGRQRRPERGRAVLRPGSALARGKAASKRSPQARCGGTIRRRCFC